MLAVELAQGEKGKSDKGMAEKAAALLQKGKSLPEAGKWRGIAQIGLLRLEYQSGQYEQLLASYKQEQIPDEVRPEMMLLVGNSHRQLGHAKEAEEIYQKIIASYPSREESKDAQYQRLINLYNSNSPSLNSRGKRVSCDRPNGRARSAGEAAAGGSTLQSAKLQPSRSLV